MFTTDELKRSKLCCVLGETEILRFAEKAADVRLAPGEWLIREGEPPSFYVLFEGKLRMVKDVLGRQQDLFEYEYAIGDFLAPRLWSRCERKRIAAWRVWNGRSSRI
jgi:thioredoxin reductase (NADPH)